MKKTDKFKPVITAVVYYGEEPRDGAVTLHGMLDIPQEVEPYVNDYRMLTIQSRANNLYFDTQELPDCFLLSKRFLGVLCGGEIHCLRRLRSDGSPELLSRSLQLVRWNTAQFVCQRAIW